MKKTIILLIALLTVFLIAGVSVPDSPVNADSGAFRPAVLASSHDSGHFVTLSSGINPEGNPVTSADYDAATLDFSEAGDQEVRDLISSLSKYKNLQAIEFGYADAESPRVSWDTMLDLHKAAPGVELRYTLTLRNVYTFSLTDEILNLNHIQFNDGGELAKKIAACMPNLRLLDMDSCGVSNEDMASIRDSLPDVTVAWRVWFGKDYTARTDATRLVASNPDRGGDLTGDAIEGLFYCTKLKYLDLGHNDKMTDISFVENMPDLEVLIIAMTNVKDISPLSNCKKLNYLEYQTAAACDLRPLKELTNLRDLNICYNFTLRDIRPLYGLELDRLWIGCLSPIPQEQIEEYRRLHPNCIVNTTTEDPTEEEWRIMSDFYPPQPSARYAQLYEEFEYANFPGCYAYIGNDSREFGRFEYY